MKQRRYCAFCGIELIKSSQKKYCSDRCARKDQFKKRCDEVDRTGVFPQSGRFNETDRRFAKVYLEQKYGHICQICKNTIWNDKPIPLVADHIDGNPSNHSVSNIRLICPNCDALLDTYKSRNLTNKSYTPGDRKMRKQEDYDRRLEAHGFERCKVKVRQHGICPECGKSFEKRRTLQKYCSRACADKNR
jgi:hypothetical protein